MEYIERETALKIIDNYSKTVSEDGKVIVKAVRDIVDTICPAADVVEVVRCKDCVYCCISTDPKTNISIQKCGYVGFNPVQSSQVSDDFYCGYGERKDGE
ncbi:MAG: hypothetical protein U0L66_07840 [Acutalibacteraceae bacterium]|nr:hypothetical protein [Acutalibacteraceae bacterium]